MNVETLVRPAAILLFASLMAGSHRAHAWGDEGHQIIGTIADHYLDPNVRTTVNQLLATDTTGLVSGTDIAHEATWADHYRDSDRPGGPRYTGTHNWHFVDIELSGPNIDTACFGHPPIPAGTLVSAGPASDCVVDKVIEFLAELQAPGTTPDERRMALQFVLHFVGDLHQPLHASDDHDSGANNKNATATGIPAGNLHHYWDTEFVLRIGSDPATVAQQLIGQITDAQASTWRQGTVADWAQESFGISRDHAYGLLPQPGSNGKYALSQAYVDDAVQVATTQLQKAGVRLAMVLNQALGATTTVACTDAMRAGAIPSINSLAGISITSSETTSSANTTGLHLFFQSALSADPSDPSGLPVAFQTLLRQAGWQVVAVSATANSYVSRWTLQVTGCGALTGSLRLLPRTGPQTYYGEIEVVDFPQ